MRSYLGMRRSNTSPSCSTTLSFQSLSSSPRSQFAERYLLTRFSSCPRNHDHMHLPSSQIIYLSRGQIQKRRRGKFCCVWHFDRESAGSTRLCVDNAGVHGIGLDFGVF